MLWQAVCCFSATLSLYGQNGIKTAIIMRFCSYEVKDWILLFFCNTKSARLVSGPPPSFVRMVLLYTNRPKRQAPFPIPSTPVKNGCLFPWLWYNTLMQNEKTILITASGKVMVFSVRSCAVLYQQAFGGILTDLVKYPENACQNQSVLV